MHEHKAIAAFGARSQGTRLRIVQTLSAAGPAGMAAGGGDRQLYRRAHHLGRAPCTATVFVWSNLTRGEPHFTLSQVALNDTIVIFAFAPVYWVFPPSPCPRPRLLFRSCSTSR